MPAVPTAADRALCELLAVESGAMAPLRTSAGGADVYRQLHTEGLIEPDRSSGRYKLTAAGRRRAEAARVRARSGAAGTSAIRGVRG